ncbi:DoxX family protein [Flavobacterium sp. H4147]|uniref:DoxX family protein n=1 Tax=Flavobacterium sp. H4147 TaxID=3034149 RepID=UPI0023ED0A03|nr:DoxX family protein [Flavobacterium sp. H4147]
MRKNNDFGLLILRLAVGILMLFHGIGKLNGGIEFIGGMLSGKGIPSFIAYGALIGEILAPLLIIIGFRTRIGALLLAINCLVAFLLVHTGDVGKLSETGGWALELLGLYFLGSLALFFTGGGSLAASKNNKWD